MLSDQELMKMHVELLFTHDDRLRLLHVNEPTGAVRPASRFFLGRTAEGFIWRFRSDLPSDLIERLEALCLNEPVVHDLREKPFYFDEYIRLLETHAPIERVWMGPAYRFPENITAPASPLVTVTVDNLDVLRSKLAEWVPDVTHCRPFLAIVQDGGAVSLCCSVRITPSAHEAGVETLDAFRRRGYASDVVAGWAYEVRKTGCTPLYSTSWENVASQSVSRKLSLVPYGVDFHVL